MPGTGRILIDDLEGTPYADRTPGPAMPVTTEREDWLERYNVSPTPIDVEDDDASLLQYTRPNLDETPGSILHFWFAFSADRTSTVGDRVRLWFRGGFEADRMRITGALATHYHPDHVGGEIFGIAIEGLARLLERQPMKVHAHRAEVAGIRQVTGLSASDFVGHEGSDLVRAGDIPIELVHTPGHTPGSQCFLIGDRLVSGDTLFVQGCGRVDLPGGDPDEMYRTLTQRLARLPETTVLYPGHDYGPTATSTLGAERQANVYMRVRSLADWRALMGR